MWFDDWDGIVRVVVLGPIVYLAVVAILRVGGAHTLARMTAWDIVVSVAIGTVYASALTSEIDVVQVVAAVAVLVALQTAGAALMARAWWVRRLVRNPPRLLLHRGEIQREELRRARVSERELHQAVRSEGRARTEDVFAVVLESDGTYSVIPSAPGDERATVLTDVEVIDTGRSGH